ncbi:MAG: nitroreductase [Frankiales bacterium]|jgi:nitroreductase|nr:nitroreductase [Frankiales bacterium]
MELKQAIRARVSTAAVTDQAPTDAQLRELLAIAAHSPDHAALRVWRLVSLRGADRERLGAALAAGFGDPAGSPEAAKTAAKAVRAPLLLGIVAAPREHPKVPTWEQIAATAGVVTTLQLLLFEAGFTAMWRTGPAIDLAEVRDVMGVAPTELLLGWLYVGGTAQAAARGGDPDVGDRLSPLPAADDRAQSPS